MSTSTLTQVLTKASKYSAACPTEFYIDVTKNSIDIYKAGNNLLPEYKNTFKVGDVAEHGSYNLRYTGVITKITAKCVTIVAYPGTRNATVHRLDMNTFCWRNYNFDAVECEKYNQNEMMYI